MTSTTSTETDAGPFSIQGASRRTGLSEPTLRYYEHVGIIPPVPRDRESGHRRYPAATLATLQSLACLRAGGMRIDDMRRYVELIDQGDSAAAEQRELFTLQATRLKVEIDRMQSQLAYLRAKAALWDARVHNDAEAEWQATAEVVALADQLNTSGPAPLGRNNDRSEQ